MFLHDSFAPFMCSLISFTKHRVPSTPTLLLIKWSHHFMNFMPIRMWSLRQGPDEQMQLAQKTTSIFWSWNSFLALPGWFIKTVAWYSIPLMSVNASSSPTASTHSNEPIKARALQNKLSIFLTVKRLCSSLMCFHAFTDVVIVYSNVIRTLFLGRISCKKDCSLVITVKWNFWNREINLT